MGIRIRALSAGLLDDAHSESGHCHGPLEMYLRPGLTVERRLEDCTVVRKTLSQPGLIEERRKFRTFACC
jgi:hypothetical protein